MSKKCSIRKALAGGICLFVICSCAKSPSLSLAERPKSWAEPVEMEGVPNLHRVSKELYRSAQPSKIGMRELEKNGIKTVVSLRFFSDDEDELAGTMLNSGQVPMLTWDADSEDDEAFLELLEKSPKPVLVHCLHGADRTGAICAVYRVKKQGWSPQEASSEMVSGGFGFHSIWGNLPKWVAKETSDERL